AQAAGAAADGIDEDEGRALGRGQLRLDFLGRAEFLEAEPFRFVPDGLHIVQHILLQRRDRHANRLLPGSEYVQFPFPFIISFSPMHRQNKKQAPSRQKEHFLKPKRARASRTTRRPGRAKPAWRQGKMPGPIPPVTDWTPESPRSGPAHPGSARCRTP